MLELVVIAAVAAAVAYLVGTAKGKADLVVLKADVAKLLPGLEAKVASAEAGVKADILAIVAEIKAKL